jgi:hypothetical protein
MGSTTTLAGLLFLWYTIIIIMIRFTFGRVPILVGIPVCPISAFEALQGIPGIPPMAFITIPLMGLLRFLDNFTCLLPFSRICHQLGAEGWDRLRLSFL